MADSSNSGPVDISSAESDESSFNGWKDLITMEPIEYGNDPRDVILVTYFKDDLPENFIEVMFNDPITLIPTDLPDHPNLSKPLEIYDEEDTIDIVWEFVRKPKGTLNDELNEWLGDKTFAHLKFHYILRKIFKCVADGLVALHEAGYAHRNLLNDNILIKSRRKAKVMGYSLKMDAYQTDETENFQIHYRAPLDEGEVPDHFKADVYALGRIIVEAFCMGGPIVVGPQDIIQMVQNNFQGSMVDLLTKMLAINQDERISMAEVAQHEWFNESYEKSTNEAKYSGFRLIDNEESGLFRPFSDKMRAQLKERGIKILSAISGGSYGNVSKVRISGELLKKNDGNELAAMKVANLSKYRGFMQWRETTIALNIAHPNIIKCLDLFTDGKRYMFIVMELAKCSLSDVNRKHSNVTAENAAEVATLMKPYLRGMCQGIAYLHNSEWVHRDIKPANVVIKMNDVAAVCDFSFSRTMIRGELTKTWSCTPQYSSPQLLMRLDSGYDPYANDVWSCGASIYDCLVGHHMVPKMTVREGWTQAQMMEEFVKIPRKLYSLKILSPDALLLLIEMLNFMEDARPSMDQVLNHGFWNERQSVTLNAPKIEAGPQPGPSRAPDYPLEPIPGPSRVQERSEPEGRGRKKFKQRDSSSS